MKNKKIDLDGKNIWDIFLAEEEREIAFWRVGEWWILAKSPVEKIVGEHGESSEELEEKIKKVAKLQSPKTKKSLDTNTTPFSSGWAGVFSYDLGKKFINRHTELDPVSRRKKIKSPANTPLFEWRKYETVICENTKTGEIFLSCDANIWEKEAEKIQNSKFKIQNYSLSPFREKHPNKIWEKGFDEVKKNIFAGEYYQLNLTRQFEADFTGDEKQLFYELYKKNPASHASFFGGKKYNILSASPELFLRFEGENVITEPIKGTGSRKKNTDEDEKERKKLLDSKKEKAELLMIADLLRNDIGQTCEAGSVKVEALREVQKNPSVWHTFSRIVGKRKKNISVLDTFFSCLPAGSISGCPKKSACENIAKIEPHSRGFFCGTFGFLNENGDGEFSILIRTILHEKSEKKSETRGHDTLLSSKDKIYFQAGGGITADSQKEEEFEEVMQKGKVFFEMGE